MGYRALPGLPLALGVTVLYVSLIICLPLGVLLFKAASLGLADYWRIVSAPRALASYRVTLLAAAGATAFNTVFGFLLAWVLVRYDFPGRRLVDALVDLPFALPTAVAGVALTTRPVITDRLDFPADHPMLDHYKYLASVAAVTPKISIPGPSCVH
ncbi:MAG TPA: hypothetical protein PKA74_04315, partial [Bauldia sp.]|nr:hypothetical protein [Bauldia sp.]